ALGGLRLVLLSGDWIPVDLPGRIRRFAPDAEIVSLGGATEGSIWSILHPIGEEDASRTSIPYGRPMADQTFHVFDDRLEERPAWVPGDLYIGGRGVASGYWRDEERTRAAFLEHPDTGERLYRTGDLGRWLPDGTIEFLGREDFQVQVQGHRVELGEIESVLLRHPRIRAAAVDAVGEARGTKSLVAYLVAEEGSPEPSGDGSPAASRAAAELPEELSGLILDPARRERFKEARWGLRRDRGDRSGVDLERPSLDRPRRAAYRGRRSRRRFRSEAVPVDRVGELMSCLLSETVDRETVYRYPSAGTLYPVQTYLYAAPGRVDGLAGGTYYHDPVAHRLVLLDPEARFGPEIHAPVNQPVAEGAAFTILLVGRLRAIAPMYGEVARDFCLLEAGYLSQLLMTECAAVGLGLCPVGGLDFDSVRGSLDLEEDDVFLHALLGGGLPEDDPSVADLEPGAADPERAASRKPSSARLLDSGHPLGEEVLDHLAAELPDYMVPSSLVLLDELPLTAVGKVDRKALPSPEEIRPERRKQSARPAAGAMEKAVAQAWSDVLEVGADDVGVEDNFFDLGGSSVHIVQVHRRLEEELGRELPLNALFRHSTISSLARFLEDGGADAAAVDEGLERGEARERARRRSSRRRRRRRNDGEEGP
ncbi:MAG: AMP-binding protein, partial [Acidobacteriota bacterium]